MPIDWSSVHVGDEIAAEEFGPVTRATLALFAGGSGDHNPLHIDTDYARAAGLEDVIAHGMLSMAFLGRYIEAIAPTLQIAVWSVRFVAPTPVGVSVRCSAVVDGIDATNGNISLRLKARTDRGVITVEGIATLCAKPIVAVPD